MLNLLMGQTRVFLKLGGDYFQSYTVAMSFLQMGLKNYQSIIEACRIIDHSQNYAVDYVLSF